PAAGDRALALVDDEPRGAGAVEVVDGREDPLGRHEVVADALANELHVLGEQRLRGGAARRLGAGHGHARRARRTRASWRADAHASPSRWTVSTSSFGVRLHQWSARTATSRSSPKNAPSRRASTSPSVAAKRTSPGTKGASRSS